nr:invasion associated locus B family protein [Acuticoccus kalidii]
MFLTAALAASGPGHAEAPDARSESYGLWTVQCETRETVDQCWMAQPVLDDNGTLVVQLELAIDGAATQLVLLAPFGLLLSEGAALSVDGAPLRTLAVRTCLPDGCLFNAGPDDALLDVLRRGERLVIRFVVADGNAPFDVEVGLAGFAAAYNRLRALATG